MNRKKIYLDGFDWVANLLNEHSRMTPGKGNHFIVVLETAQVFPTDLISALVQSKLEKRLPLLNGSIHRHLLHLAPYWKPGPGKAPAVTEEELLFTSDYSAALDRFGNTPLPPHQALALHVIRHKTGSALLFKFSHLLFDGRGAELLLEAFCPGGGELLEQSPGLSTPRLDEWEKQFSAGKQIQRRWIALRNAGPFSGRSAAETAASACRVIALSEAETDALRNRSDTEAGPFMMTPFLLALTARQYNAMLSPYDRSDSSLLIPMSVDMRGQDGIPADALFFNQWSMLPIALKRSILADPVRTVEETRRQIFTGTGERIALAYRAASRLTRIAPPFLLMKIIRRLGPSVSGSFMFSFISGSSLSEARFAGRKLSNLYHLPSMPPIAGLGVFFNMFDNRLNAVISYRSGVFPEADVDRFARKLEKELRGNGGE